MGFLINATDTLKNTHNEYQKSLKKAVKEMTWIINLIMGWTPAFSVLSFGTVHNP